MEDQNADHGQRTFYSFWFGSDRQSADRRVYRAETLIVNLIRLMTSAPSPTFRLGEKNFGVISPFLLLSNDTGRHAIDEREVGLRVSDHALIITRSGIGD